MDTLYPISLPYGLSPLHRWMRQTGKIFALPLGDREFFIPSLQALCPPPPGNPPGAIRLSDLRLSKAVLKKTRKMGMHFTRRTMRLPLKAMEKRNRTSKPKAQPKQSSKHLRRATTKKKTFGPGTRLKAGDGPKYPLIIEDSDDEERQAHRQAPIPMTRRLPEPRTDTATWLKEAVRPANPITASNLSHYRYARSTPDHINAPIDQATNIFKEEHGSMLMGDLPAVQVPILSRERDSSLASAVVAEEKSHSVPKHEFNYLSKTAEHSPARFTPTPPQIVMNQQIPSRTAYPTPARTEREFLRDNSKLHCFEEVESTQPTTMRELKNAGQFTRLKEPTPGLYKRPGAKPILSRAQSQGTKGPMEQTSAPLTVRTFNTPSFRRSICEELTLADIPDLGLRMKVAKLMAVAPSLPVKHIYDLLIEMKGNYENAKNQVSQTPQPAVRPHDYLLAPKPTGRIQHDDEEEATVKVDFDNPDIYLDNDVPSSPFPPPVFNRAPSKQKHNRSRVKSQISAITNTEPTLKASATIVRSKIKSKPEAKAGRTSANIGMKRAFDASRAPRRNNFGDFVLIDDDSEDDGSYRDKGSVCYSDDEGSDIDMEEDLATNLHIAMKRPFHFPGDKMDTDE